MKTTVEIEEEMDSTLAALERQVRQYKTDCRVNAEAEASYRHAYNVGYVTLCDTGGKMAAGEKDARVSVDAALLYGAWKIAEAAEKSTKQVLVFLQAKIDSLRTLAANTRQFEGSR